MRAKDSQPAPDRESAQGQEDAIVEVTGVLYPVYDQDCDNIAGVMLAGTDDHEYLLRADRFFDALLELSQEGVRVRGRVSMDGNQRMLDVHDYERTEIAVDPRQDAWPDPLDDLGHGYRFEGLD